MGQDFSNSAWKVWVILFPFSGFGSSWLSCDFSWSFCSVGNLILSGLPMKTFGVCHTPTTLLPLCGPHGKSEICVPACMISFPNACQGDKIWKLNRLELSYTAGESVNGYNLPPTGNVLSSTYPSHTHVCLAQQLHSSVSPAKMGHSEH